MLEPAGWWWLEGGGCIPKMYAHKDSTFALRVDVHVCVCVCLGVCVQCWRLVRLHVGKSDNREWLQSADSMSKSGRLSLFASHGLGLGEEWEFGSMLCFEMGRCSEFRPKIMSK